MSSVGFVLAAAEPPAGFADIPDMETDGWGVVMGERFFSRGIRGAEESGEFGLVEGGPSVKVCSSSSEEEDSGVRGRVRGLTHKGGKYEMVVH